MRFPDNVISSLTSLVVLATSSSSSSSSLATTEDLASLLLCFAVVMLVAGGGGGGGGGGGVVMATGSFNYTDLGPAGSRRGGGGGGRGALGGLAGGQSPRQLDRDVFLTKLGPDFDAARMSIDQPPTHSRASSAVPEFDPELVDDLRELDFSYADERGERRTIPSAVRGVVERWLLERAACPVRYAWLDMGALFWPRWIKQGYCDADVPCSWPPGMHCAPAMSDTLRLLHWQCNRSRRVKRRSPDAQAAGKNTSSSSSSPFPSSQKNSEGGGRRPKRSPRQQHQCRWRKVPFPVTSECFCSC